MTAPTDHLAAAREALASTSLTSSSVTIDRLLACAQVHATLALAEEAHTTNLIRSLDYGFFHRADVDERRAEITARLWPTS